MASDMVKEWTQMYCRIINKHIPSKITVTLCPDDASCMTEKLKRFMNKKKKKKKKKKKNKQAEGPVVDKTQNHYN